MHMLSMKYKSSGELETLRNSRNPTTAVTANEEVHTNDEAQVYVHDLDLFVTVQLLEDTPAVFPLGKLCQEHGYAYEWTSGQKPHLTTRWEDNSLQDGKCRACCCPGIVVKLLRKFDFCIVTSGLIKHFFESSKFTK